MMGVMWLDGTMCLLCVFLCAVYKCGRIDEIYDNEMKDVCEFM